MSVGLHLKIREDQGREQKRAAFLFEIRYLNNVKKKIVINSEVLYTTNCKYYNENIKLTCFSDILKAHLHNKKCIYYATN